MTVLSKSKQTGKLRKTTLNINKVVTVLQDTCFHLVFAGHDSSASALSMLLHYLKKEAWAVDKLRQEQTQVSPSISKMFCNTRCLLCMSKPQACCDIQDNAADPLL